MQNPFRWSSHVILDTKETNAGGNWVFERLPNHHMPWSGKLIRKQRHNNACGIAIIVKTICVRILIAAIAGIFHTKTRGFNDALFRKIAFNSFRTGQRSMYFLAIF